LPDLTFFVDGSHRDALDEAVGRSARQGAASLGSTSNLHRAASRDCTLRFDLDGRTTTGRALICSCFSGRYMSVTVRVSGDDVQDVSAVDWPVGTVSKAAPPKSAWRRPDAGPHQIKRQRRVLRTFVELSPATGLIVVAGRTGSGKTTFAKDLCATYLENLCRQYVGALEQGRTDVRAPHVVTFEDPVELRLADTHTAAQDSGFDYTPRVKGVDAPDLASALRDALRQTPALVYVGETRDHEDWTALLNFAATGHLLITTTHAGSVVDTMSRIFEAARARTPDSRSEVAHRVRMLVHMKRDDETRQFIPALWLSTRESINAVGAEGLSSMIPQAISPRGCKSNGNYGRAFFAKNYIVNTDMRATLEGRILAREIVKRATAWDLNGE
jgi:hypothetical protein